MTPVLRSITVFRYLDVRVSVLGGRRRRFCESTQIRNYRRINIHYSFDLNLTKKIIFKEIYIVPV